MILPREESEVIRFGEVSEVGFTISEDSDFLIDALINLYSKKEESILREIVSNAYDASLETEEKRVVIIINDDKIVVQDFGTGMSPEFMKTKYTKVGLSTKKESASAIGYYGLGRISVLSNSNSYNVVTCFEGVEYNWLIWRDTKINIDLISSVCSENTGTRVEFNIKDPKKWFDTAKNTLEFFDGVIIHCEAKGVKTEYVTKPVVVEKGNKYGLRNGSINNTSKLGIILGKVKYPIDFETLEIPIVNSEANIFLPLDSGLKPVPSRESIIYSEKTKDYLREKIKEFQDYCEAEIQVKLDEAQKKGIVEYKKAFDDAFVEWEGVKIYNNSIVWPYKIFSYYVGNWKNFITVERKKQWYSLSSVYVGKLTTKVIEYLGTLGVYPVKGELVSCRISDPQERAEWEECQNYYLSKCYTPAILETPEYLEWEILRGKKSRNSTAGLITYFRRPYSGDSSYVKDKMEFSHVLKHKGIVLNNVPDRWISTLTKSKFLVIQTKLEHPKIINFDIKSMKGKEKLIIGALVEHHNLKNLWEAPRITILMATLPFLAEKLIQIEHSGFCDIPHYLVDEVLEFKDELVTDLDIQGVLDELPHLYFLDFINNYTKPSEHTNNSFKRSYIGSKLLAKKNINWKDFLPVEKEVEEIEEKEELDQQTELQQLLKQYI